VINNLIQKNVKNIIDFEWMAQLRYYF